MKLHLRGTHTPLQFPHHPEPVRAVQDQSGKTIYVPCFDLTRALHGHGHAKADRKKSQNDFDRLKSQYPHLFQDFTTQVQWPGERQRPTPAYNGNGAVIALLIDRCYVLSGVLWSYCSGVFWSYCLVIVMAKKFLCFYCLVFSGHIVWCFAKVFLFVFFCHDFTHLVTLKGPINSCVLIVCYFLVILSGVLQKCFCWCSSLLILHTWSLQNGR
jgi:hypothetical protein